MTALVLCGDCKGRDVYPRCRNCHGHGRVLPTDARDRLVFEVLGDDIGGTAALTALRLLDANRPAFFAWLIETGIVQPTELGRNPIDRDPTVKPWSQTYVPSGFEIVPADRIDERGHRLYMVAEQ